MKNKPRRLFWDIETSLNVVSTFSFFKTNIPHKWLIEPWYMICASWRWEGEKKIHSVSVLDGQSHTDDSVIVAALYDVLSQADSIVAHNGDAFDIKKFNARAIYYGYAPLPNIIQEDTLKMARSKFAFPYNRLDALGEYLGVGRKVHVETDLWTDCLMGDTTAIKKMIKYNKGDITLLQNVYDRISPWVPSKLNMNHFSEERVCPKCGSHNLHISKYKLTRAGKQVQLHCQHCGHYSSMPVSKLGKEGLAR